jgi:hypothetical protein
MKSMFGLFTARDFVASPSTPEKRRSSHTAPFM